MRTIVLDWDGTMVPNSWPEQPTEFMPGAVEAVKRLYATGRFHMRVSSARLNPYDPYTFQRRHSSIVESETQYIRDMLDSAGLTFVDIWTLDGKTPGDLYIDDKGERYSGRPSAWTTLAEKILARWPEGDENEFPVFDMDVAARSLELV